MIKIGGEFEIAPSLLNGYRIMGSSTGEVLYSNGRSAFMAILFHLMEQGKSVIHIPYYICPSIVDACGILKYRVRFYEPDPSFLFPLDYLDTIRQGEVLLSVYYFGLTDDNPRIISIKQNRPDITIISDHVQSIGSYHGSEADYSFTSFRKYMPTPDGAAVYSGKDDIRCTLSQPENSFFWYKLVGSLLKHNKVEDETYLSYFKQGESVINSSSLITRASDIGHYLSRRVNMEELQQKRKENTRLIYEIGTRLGLNFLFPYKEDRFPTFIPILLEKRNRIREKLMKNNVYLPVHWPQESYNAGSPISERLSRQELSLINDQRYTCDEIEFQIKTIIK